MQTTTRLRSSSAAAHAAIVDGDVDPDNESKEDTADDRPKILKDKTTVATTLTASPPSAASSKTKTHRKTKLLWIEHIKKLNPQSRRADDSGRNRTTDSQPAQSTRESNWDDSQTPQRPPDKTHHAVEPGDLDQSERSQKTWTMNQKRGGRHKLSFTISNNTQRRPRPHE